MLDKNQQNNNPDNINEPMLGHRQKILTPSKDFVDQMQNYSQQGIENGQNSDYFPTKEQAVDEPFYSESSMNNQQPSQNNSFDNSLRPANKRPGIKKIAISAFIILFVFSAIIASVIFFNVVSFVGPDDANIQLSPKEFKTVSYVNSDDTHFQLSFYSNYRIKKVESDNKQLVSLASNVSKDDKYPISLSISNSDKKSYDLYKNCPTYDKVLDVNSVSLNQVISVCDIYQGRIFMASISENNKYYLVSIGQDYSKADLLEPNKGQESLTRFGLGPYKDDIKNIVASIKPN